MNPVCSVHRRIAELGNTGVYVHANDPFLVKIVTSPASQAGDDLWGAEAASPVATPGVHRSPA